MATYYVPQPLVYQEFNVVPAVADAIRAAHLSGPNALLIRNADSSEKNLGLLGYYDSADDQAYAWPNRPVGGIADQSYTKLFIENALLRYFSDQVGGGSTFTKLAGYNNRIRVSNKILTTTPAGTVSSEFGDRGVKAGDVIKVRGLNGSGQTVTLWSTVKSLIADVSAASVGAAGTDADNPNTSVASASVTQIAGANNNIEATTSATNYDGLPSGYVTETYDVLVTESSMGGDLTKAKLRVISGSGTDDVASVTPSAGGVATSIGTRGLTVTFSRVTGHDSLSASSAGVSPRDLIAGQRWRVTVVGAFTKPVPTAAGTFTGTFNASYVITVTRGGKYSSNTKPQITVTTSNGVDLSGPTTVTAAASAVAVGNYGVTIAFSGTGLRKGDKYYIDCVGTGAGPVRVLELSHNLDITMPNGTQVALDLFILKPNLTVNKNRLEAPPTLNWTTSATEFTTKAGATAFDDSWTVGGSKVALPIISESSKGYGKMFVEARYWLADLLDAVTFVTLNDYDTVIPGPLSPDNPLKYGAYQALSTSNGTPVGVTAVKDPSDLDDWASALAATVGDTRIRTMVVLSKDREVQSLLAGHISNLSGPIPAQWRSAFMALPGFPKVPVVASGSTIVNHITATTTDGLDCLAVIEDDPGTGGTQYTRVRCTSGNGGFLANKVRAGDIVRALYTTDGFGGLVYSEFVVDSVISEDQLLLAVGPAAPVNSAAKIEIWRNLRAEDESTEILTAASSFGSRRICAVWPDTLEVGSLSVDGYFACCALAGLCSGILPQRALTKLSLSTFSGVSRTVRRFSSTQLDKMAGNGVFILTQDLNDGTIYVRHGVTTGAYEDVNQREEVITRAQDYISYGIHDLFAPLTAQRNLFAANILRTRVELENFLDAKTKEALSTDSGPPITEFTIVTFERHPTLRDRLKIEYTSMANYPMNNAEIHQIVL